MTDAEPGTERGNASDGVERETHIDDELGLFVPKDLREFDSQIVFRTPRATIQHFGSQPLDGYYGMIRADQFGDPDDMCGPKNPELAPDRVTIKPQGEEPVTLTVETDPEIRTDGGANPSIDRRWAEQEYRMYKQHGRPSRPYYMKCLRCMEVWEIDGELLDADDSARRHAGVHSSTR